MLFFTQLHTSLPAISPRLLFPNSNMFLLKPSTESKLIRLARGWWRNRRRYQQQVNGPQQQEQQEWTSGYTEENFQGLCSKKVNRHYSNSKASFSCLLMKFCARQHQQIHLIYFLLSVHKACSSTRPAKSAALKWSVSRNPCGSFNAVLFCKCLYIACVLHTWLARVQNQSDWASILQQPLFVTILKYKNCGQSSGCLLGPLTRALRKHP